METVGTLIKQPSTPKKLLAFVSAKTPKFQSPPVFLFIAVTFLFFVFSEPFGFLEDQFLDLRYEVRGERLADTNVVILYFDHDDLTALGGWPLKRNLYALLIDVLHKLGASAIGLDVFFAEEHREDPEYGRLLAATAARSGNVVFPAYFRELGREADSVDGADLPENLSWKTPGSGWTGRQISLPFVGLQDAAGGLGHTNLVDQTNLKVPVYVNDGGRSLPALGLELLRVSLGLERDEVVFGRDEVRMMTKDAIIRIAAPEGAVDLNIPGSLSSFARYRCVEVLRSHRLKEAGLPSAIDLDRFRNKIILVGVIAEGRSSFFQTPYGRMFPAVAVHAVFLDNALSNRFLTKLTWAPALAFTIAFGILALFVLGRRSDVRGILMVSGILVGYCLLAFVLFSAFAWIVPIVQPLLVAIITSTGVLVSEYRKTGRQINLLREQQRMLESELREREVTLQLMERELMEGGRSSGDLLEEIRRYKKEVRELSTRLADVVGFDATHSPDGDEEDVFEDILYCRGGAMEIAVRMTDKVAPSAASVLILGESGTGKELVARALHRRSPRNDKPFVALNCAAIPEGLLESELFGHVKGSFTGAFRDKPGLIESANGGTLFLDEIAETNPGFQGKLLRVLQEQEIQPVGATAVRKVDVRILAATNKDIKSELEKGTFREDLYFRLNTVTIQLPPLRERRNEIPILVKHFLRKEAPALSFSTTAVEALQEYHWPGNVRELESAVRRAIILVSTEGRTLVRLQDLPEDIVNSAAQNIDIEERILESLRAKDFSRSSISETAAELGGLNRGTVAEYYRGVCFKTFFEKSWNLEQTVAEIARTEKSDVRERVMKKVQEYLGNVIEAIRPGQSYDLVKNSLQPKYKNLPQRYHLLLDEVIRAYLEGRWRSNW